jgi:predicted outer membrane repeat protein
LRSALQTAAQDFSAGTTNVTINLHSAGTYAISLAGTPGETDNQAGEFAINNLAAGDSLTINNQSGGAVVLNANGLGRVLDINPADTSLATPATVTFNGNTGGLTIANGATGGSGGGIRDQGSVNLTLNNVTVTGNTATADGGGIAMENAASVPWVLTLNGSTVSNNHAGAAGGGIETDGTGIVNIANSSLTDNTAANQGGAIWLDAVADNTQVGSVTVADGGSGYTSAPTVTFSAPSGAGGTTATGFATVADGTVTSVTITNAGSGYTELPTVTFSAPGTPGGTGATGSVNPVRASANLSLTNTFVGGNSAGLLGGGIGNGGAGPVVLTQNTIQGNSTAGFGGGFADQNNLGTLLVQDSLFLGNTAATDGGGIQAGGPATTLANTEIQGNTAGDDGGGLFADGTILTITGSTFADNVAGTAGGGLEVETTGGGSQPGSTVTNSTITRNRVLSGNGTGAGGGIGAGFSGFLANSSGGSYAFTGALALLNDTITGNSADGGGGIAWAGASGFTGTAGSAFASSISVQNTILATNTAHSSGPDVQSAAGTFTDLGGNLIGVNDGTTGFSNPATLTGPFASLVSGLADNGGPTVGSTGHSMTLETQALPPTNSAIGKGTDTALATDERGFPRIGEAQDPGAFQFQNVTLRLNLTATSFNGADTLTVTVTNTGSIPLPADHSTVTIALPAGLTVSAGTPLAFTLATLASGQSAIFSVTATGAPGSQTVTATLNSPDANPNTLTASAKVTPGGNHIPLGTLTVFGVGFSPGFQLEVFEVDAQGQVFVQPFSFGFIGAPVYFNSDMFLSEVSIQDNAMLSFLTGVDGQKYPIALLNFSNPYVFDALLANLVNRRG